MADSHYCPMCGVEHGGESEDKVELEAVEEMTRADVEIERIRAEKEIKLAKIAAGIAESETQIEAAHAEGRAEGMHEVLDAATPDPEPVSEPEPVVVVPDDSGPSTDVLEPPEATGHADGEAEPKPRSKSRGLGLW